MTSGRLSADWSSLPYGGDLFGELQLAENVAASRRGSQFLACWPGLAVCGVAAVAAAWLSEHYGFPAILLGLLIGFALNFVSQDSRTHPGLDLASRDFLRFGIVLLGLQVTFGQIATLGTMPFAALILVMSATFLAGLAGAWLAGRSSYAGILAGGATAICGASAALALYGVVGRDRLNQGQFAMTLVAVSLASSLALSIYPVLARELHFSPEQAGFLTGAAIHDVAQAIGAGYAFSDAAGSYATLVKLARVAMLAPVVALVGLAIGPADRQDGRAFWKRLALPWFIVGFLIAIALNSLIAIPPGLQTFATGASKALLLLAVTAAAMRSRIDLLLNIGWRAAAPVAAATFASFAASLGLAFALF